MTVPLLATASGQKMGKSAGGAVWLNADKLSDFTVIMKDQLREWPEASASLTLALKRHGAQVKQDPASGELVKAERSEWHYIGDDDDDVVI